MGLPRILAGPKLDELVAEKVMGWVVDPIGRMYTGGELRHSRGENLETRFNPSTDMRAAWEVVEKIRSESLSLGWRQREFSIEQSDRLEKGLWVCRTTGTPDSAYANGRSVYATAGTAPLVICIAALDDVGAL